MKYLSVLFITIVLQYNSLSAQEALSNKDIQAYVSHFRIANNQLVLNEQDAAWSIIENAKFVGIAELHHSKQISVFTEALLNHLKPHDFTNFVMEIGPYSEDYLSKLKKTDEPFDSMIKRINTTYGNKKNRVYPIPFVADRVDAKFLEVVRSQNYNIIGLDQEYIFSIPMHLDILNQRTNPKDIKYLKEKVKKALSKGIKKKGYFSTCELLEDKDLNSFFDSFQDAESVQYIDDLKNSLSIYCQVQKGTGGYMERLEILKENFLKYFDSDSRKIEKSVFKFGTVHLAKEENIYNVKDLGYTINELAKQTDSGFIVLRQLKRYFNGKDLIDTKTWKKYALFLEYAEKDRWTLIDLRQLKEKIDQRQLSTDNEDVLFQINNYDFILIPPNDTRAEMNF